MRFHLQIVPFSTIISHYFFYKCDLSFKKKERRNETQFKYKIKYKFNWTKK